MFIAKNMPSIRLKQNALILGYLLGYLLDYQFSPKATLDTLFTLARFFSPGFTHEFMLLFSL